MTATKSTTYLKDYRPPEYLVDTIELRVELHPQQTKVRSTLRCRLNPAAKASNDAPLTLQGEQLELLRLSLNGAELDANGYSLADGLLTIAPVPSQPFTVEIETRINPSANTELEGLYLSSGNYCTQCEAEGFRKITFFPDRPDVMSIFTTTVIGDQQSCPVLLSNGNLVEQGTLPQGRHFATWRDPFPKPCYLFALVAGDLACIRDRFITASGREVGLYIYVEARNEAKCAHAMQALKKAMRWDEERFGREYDLERYMIVAVDDFNMGAMENKGLNVFNSKYVLALPETATDADYEGIEAVIAHEYFHNWTGNRITCRDWFQLSLKEGLTVFRDQEFSSDIVSRPVKRIQDANIIRSLQFREDAGPMAHPVRPESFVEINNFYTLTVYNKGAEVIRMLHTILGQDQFRRGMDIYFARHDGQAVTCEDFIAAMEAASGMDLSQFMRWYSQAGAPELTVQSSYDGQQKQLRLQVRQCCPPTPEAQEKKPFLIPIVLGLLDAAGNDMAMLASAKQPGQLLLLSQREQAFCFDGVDSPPTISFLRGFSAPVKLHFTRSEEELAQLMSHDSDPFNRWDAGQELALQAILRQMEANRSGNNCERPTALLTGISRLLADQQADPAFVALALILPTENWLGQQLQPLDPGAVFVARQQLRALLGRELRTPLLLRHQALAATAPYRYTPQEAGRRALRNGCLAALLCPAPGEQLDAELLHLGRRQYAQADNMTDAFAALSAVVNADRSAGDLLLQDFYAKWRHDPLVMDKWLAVQASCSLPGTLTRVRQLAAHPVFSITNPNKVRALFSTFCALNQAQFHAEDGEGYCFLADQVLRLDAINPQIAARMAAPLSQWRRLEDKRQQLMRTQLERIQAAGGLSDDVQEVITKSLQ